MAIINEKQLQAKIYLDFSQQRPKEKGCLWSVRNTTLSKLDGITQKAMGMVKGVSDLIRFHNCQFTGIEVKLPGKEHSKEHIITQYNWGRTMEANGGKYYIVTSLEQFWRVINNKVTKDDYHLDKIEEIIKNSKSKIIFN